MSQQISKSLYIFYEIVSFLPYEEKLRMQLISRKFYDNIVPYNIKASSVRSASHAVGQDRVYQYASGYIMYRELSAIIADVESGNPDHKNEKWQYLRPRNQDYVSKEGLNKQLKFGRTLYIPYNKLLVISGDNVDLPKSESVNDTFTFCLLTNNVERMPDIRLSRTSFAAHYDFGDRYVYILGGSNKQDKMIKECEKFDVFNQKWSDMPMLNMERGNPGTFLSACKRYLYAFQGFKNTQMTGGPLGFKQSEALNSIERLDLWNEHAGWELHMLSTKKDELTKPLRPKGCFVMFNLDEFDFQSINTSSSVEFKSSLKGNMEEEKQTEDDQADMMQIDPSPKTVTQDNSTNDTTSSLFHENAIKYGLRDKIMIFGGWQPYENLKDIEIFDARKNQVEDILPLALNVRGEHHEAKKSILQQQMISASTAHESNGSDEYRSHDANSDYSDDDGDLDIEMTDEGRTAGIDEQNLEVLNRLLNAARNQELNLQGTESPPDQRREIDDGFDESYSDDEDVDEERASAGDQAEMEDEAAGEGDHIAKLRAKDQEQRGHIYFKHGDKFTKKPLQCGRYLVLLGRMHIQVFDVQTFTNKTLLYHGEDQAERMGESMKKIDAQNSEKEKSAYKNRPRIQAPPQNQLLALVPGQVRGFPNYNQNK